MKLFAVVWKARPDVIVEETGAPFDGATIEDAERECKDTFGKHPDWLLVEMTSSLDAQYRRLDNVA